MTTENSEVPFDDKLHDQLLRVVEKKGIPEGEREAEIKRIEEEFDERVIDELLTALPGERIEELKAVLSKEGDGVDDEFMDVIEKSGVSFESVSERVLKDFLEEYLGEEIDNSEEEE